MLYGINAYKNPTGENIFASFKGECYPLFTYFNNAELAYLACTQLLHDDENCIYNNFFAAVGTKLIFDVFKLSNKEEQRVQKEIKKTRIIPRAVIIEDFNQFLQYRNGLWKRINAALEPTQTEIPSQDYELY